MNDYENMGKKITVRLDGRLADRLHARAAQERVPVSFVLRHLVLRYLSAKPEPDRPTAPRSAGCGRRVLTAVENEQQAFRAEVCALFDAFRGQGCDAKEATKRTNFALKAKEHPWATFDVVSKALRDAGRFRTIRRGKR